jgi:hypothetical protein
VILHTPDNAPFVKTLDEIQTSMKKFMKITLATVGITTAAILLFTYISYNSWSPGEVTATVDPSATAYFLPTYEQSRDTFRSKAINLQNRFDGVEVFSITVESKIDNDLTIDFCYLPPTNDQSKLVILSSGLHGVEGPTGSAVQSILMDKVANFGLYLETGILLVHAINPYGFKYSRRVSENNVDLNRNCSSDISLYSSLNNGYTELYEMLNPTGEVRSGSLRNRFFLLVAIEKLVQKSMKSLRQAALQGQYEYPKGLYFGGKNPEPQIKSVIPVFMQYAADYETVLSIDIHTGYGERGVLHLFPNPVKDPAVRSAMEHIFKGYPIDWGDSDDFYTTNGSFTDFTGTLMPGKFFIPMVFEYGTLDSKTIIGSIRSIHNMVLENQGFHYGYAEDSDRTKVQENFSEMYNPSCEVWRSKVIADSRDMLDLVFSQLESL